MVGLEREKRLAEEDLEHLILKDFSDILELELYKNCRLEDLFSSASSAVRMRRAAESAARRSRAPLRLSLACEGDVVAARKMQARPGRAGTARETAATPATALLPVVGTL